MISSVARYLFVFGILLFVNTLPAQNLSPEKVIYRGNPLPVTLSVAHERRITFEHPIYVDVPESLIQLTTQIVGPDLYWRASEAFDPIRLVIGEEGGNRIYLIYLSAVQQDNAAPQLLVSLKEQQAVNKQTDPEVAVFSNTTQPKIGYGGLFRYAAKQLYAPDRLRDSGAVNNLSKAPIPEGRVHHLIRFHKVITQAMGAWQNDTHYVTALLVTNATDLSIILDPREIRGEVLAARFHRNHLEPIGSPGDTTSLFLITDRPLAEAITGHAVRIDSPPLRSEQFNNQVTD